MLILGIESSCDETAASVVEDGRRVRSSSVASQDELHVEYGGVVPEIASRAHVERIVPVVRTALERAGVTLDDVNAIAVGHRPGLIGSLLVGISGAKALAWSLGVPLIGVDHVHAHLFAGCLDRDPPALPALGLVVSGGHTATYACPTLTDIERLGVTIDDASGEAFDKAAAILGLGYPGGPAIDRLASDPAADARAHEFPVSRLGRESLDFSFSGLKTALLYAVRGVPGKDERREPLTDEARRDFAAGFQRAVVRALILKLGRALKHMRERGEHPETLLAGGGVTANSALRASLGSFADEHGLELRLPAMAYCVDNAAMIAGLAYHLRDVAHEGGLSLTASPASAL